VLTTWQAARTFLISALTRSIIAIYILISVSRIRALYTYYKAPVDVLTYLQLQELPRLSAAAFPDSHPTPAPSNGSMEHLDRYGRAQDFEPLRPLNLSLCYGSEWYRFPSHFLVPEPVTVRLVDVGVPGIMPKHFLPLTRLEATRSREPRFNDLNRPETDQYVGFLGFHTTELSFGAVRCECMLVLRRARIPASPTSNRMRVMQYRPLGYRHLSTLPRRIQVEPPHPDLAPAWQALAERQRVRAALPVEVH
jgi:hypothetical protein